MQLKLGELLLSEHMITSEQLDEALKINRNSGKKLGSILVKLGFVDEENVMQLLSKKLNVPLVCCKEVEAASPEAVSKISRDFAAQYRVIPFRLERNTLSVAMSDPYDIKAQDEIQMLTGLRVKRFIAPDFVISRALGRFYRIGGEEVRYTSLIEPVPIKQQPQIAIFQIKSETGEVLNITSSAELAGFGTTADTHDFALPQELSLDSDHFSYQESENQPDKIFRYNSLNSYECAAMFNILERKGIITKKEMTIEVRKIRTGQE